MTKPRALDLFCGAGGATRGLHTEAAKRRAMGIDWMRRAELAQAIPPPYAEVIGQAAIEHLAGRPL